jgi:hypothetical protein
VKVVTSHHHLIEITLLLLLNLIPINILHLHNLALLSTQDGSSIDVGLELIPKPIVNPQILPHNIGIFTSRLLDCLPTLGIISDWMWSAINGRNHGHLTHIIFHVADVKLSEMLRSVRNLISGVSLQLLTLLILDILIRASLAPRPCGAALLLPAVVVLP